MADQQNPEAPRPLHNPFDAPQQKGLGKGFTIAMAIVLVYLEHQRTAEATVAEILAAGLPAPGANGRALPVVQ